MSTQSDLQELQDYSEKTIDGIVELSLSDKLSNASAAIAVAISMYSLEMHKQTGDNNAGKQAYDSLLALATAASKTSTKKIVVKGCSNYLVQVKAEVGINPETGGTAEDTFYCVADAKARRMTKDVNEAAKMTLEEAGNLLKKMKTLGADCVLTQYIDTKEIGLKI